MLGCIAPATELSAPIPASIGAFLESIFGAPHRPCLVAWPNLSKRPPVNCAPPPGSAAGPVIAGAAVAAVAAVCPAAVGIPDAARAAVDAVFSAASFATTSGEVIALFTVAPRVPACEPAPADPNLVANCCASSGLFRAAAPAALTAPGAAAPRPILAPNTPAPSPNKPPALPPRRLPPTPAAPARPAPPKAPRPAIRPLLKSPVIAVEPAATIPAASGAPIPVAARPKPISVGSNLLRKPASGKPVCGLIVSEPPCAIANCCRPPTSPGVMWTSILSSPRP